MALRDLVRFPRRRGKAAPRSGRASSRSGIARRSLREPVPRSVTERVGRLLRAIPHTPFALLLTVLVVGSGVLLWNFATASNYFVVSEWEVEGTERLSDKEVLALVRGEKKGDGARPNIWSFNLGAARERLLQHPAVLDAGLSRVPPDRIEVRLAERREVALLITATGAHLVDAEGRLFRRASTPELLNGTLPILTFRGAGTYETGDELPRTLFDEAMLYVLTLNEAGSALADELSEVSVHPEHGIDLVLRGGARLHCGFLGPERTLPRAEAFIGRVGWPGAVEYADLRLPEDLPWKPADPEALRAMLAHR